MRFLQAPYLPAGRYHGDTRDFPGSHRVITGRGSKEGGGVYGRSPNRRCTGIARTRHLYKCTYMYPDKSVLRRAPVRVIKCCRLGRSGDRPYINQTPTILAGIHIRTSAWEKVGLSEIFDCRTGKCNRKQPSLTLLKAAVYAASLPHSCSALAPWSKNGIG